MPPSQTSQKAAFSFLRQHFLDGTTFSRADLLTATGWGDSTLTTYLLKQFEGVIVEKNGTLRVTWAFQKISTWRAFQRHVSQNKSIVNKYTAICHSDVVIFEFLMPLANEIILREALDALFFKETVQRRIELLPQNVLGNKFPLAAGETNDGRLARVVEFVSQKFGGYSISHVDGRFRANTLLTRDESASLQSNGERYLVDETTAIVKFIFPCGQATTLNNLLDPDLDNIDLKAGAIAEADKIRWLFFVLFVDVITQIVNGEDEIWLIESGMNSRLHIWRN